ncbi:hypothetical protein [Priestia megaterium]|uniref:hypothetical protein n=1 Tax=Priestia megaterium TaxID=1404 RepID=UPI00159BB63E|nr:hypothetical protein [Priestia megaterium]
MEGKAKTPVKKAHATRRLIGRLRKAKPCTEINSERSILAHVSNLFVFRMDYAFMSQSSFI